MTFRAKPVVKRAQRPSWHSHDRRNFYMNLGFGLVVLAAVLILLIAAGISWYSDHLAPAGSVNGQSITIDDLRDRVKIETWRLNLAGRRINDEKLKGHITEAQATSLLQSVDSQIGSVATIALERIIDNRIQATLATDEGISITSADVDARLVVEATIKEARHAWMIEVQPAIDAGAIDPTDAQKAAARAKAQAALQQIQGGKAFADVAKTASTDAATAPQGGDLGWLQKADTQTDEPFLTALFAAAVNTPTAVVEGDDGIFRVGEVTEISAETVDPLYQQKLQDDGIDLAKYRAVVNGDVVHEKLEDKIVSDATAPGPQRQVSEIFISKPDDTLPADAIKVRQIQFSPKDDPTGASDGTIPADDPSWTQAEKDADAVYARLKADPSLFDSIARTESDDEGSAGPNGSGGKLPYLSSESDLDEGLAAFQAAILKPGLGAGDLLKPVKSSLGWHVIQVMYRPTDDDRIKTIKTLVDGGSDFATLARDNSESASAGHGGDLGWIAKGQLSEQLTTAIFGTVVGKTSAPVVVATGDDAGEYLFKVFAEETRTPEGRQLETIRSTAFSTWYTEKKNAVKIERDPSPTGLLS